MDSPSLVISYYFTCTQMVIARDDLPHESTWIDQHIKQWRESIALVVYPSSSAIRHKRRSHFRAALAPPGGLPEIHFKFMGLS